VAYDLETPLFSDYALKRRFAYVPAGQQATFRPDAVADFPVGSVLVKTFAFPADLRRPEENVRVIETRLLIHKQDGWSAAAYVWDADGREARLAIAGAQIPVRFTDAGGVAREIAYSVPNKNQCKGCHALDDAVTPIGPTMWNFRPVSDAAPMQDQVQRWMNSGLFNPDVTSPDRRLKARSARAREYLDVNCAHCHNPRGPASNSGLDLRVVQTDPSHWGVRKRPVAAGRASAGLLYAIDPGHPERSILLHRMESADPGVMMPELGRTLVHAEGVALIREWIAAMDQNGAVAEKID
jgi:uncharacterized repeat protein (TIGR03806 family)